MKCGAILLTAALTATAARDGAAQIRLPDALRGAANVARSLLPISTAKEIEIGRGIAATVAGRYPVSTDTALTAYLNLVGLAVAAESPRGDIAYRFALLETPDVNAFAAPGGYIFVTRGALDLMQSEAELAAVLAHEIGHVNRRHVIEQIRKSDAMQSVRSEAGLTGNELDQVIGAGANTLFMGLSRSDEAEADSLGLVLAASAGYDHNGLMTFVGRLASGGSEGTLAELRSSHPPAQERLAALRRIAGRGGFPQGATLAERFLAVRR